MICKSGSLIKFFKLLIFKIMIYVNSIFTPDQTGRLGGVVFGKNKYGYYIKTFKPPTNPRTDAQQNIRAYFAAASREWASMNSEQINEWNSIASTIQYVKKGVSYSLTGFNLFVKLNRDLQTIGGSFYKDITRSGLLTPADMADSFVQVKTTPGSEDIKLNIPATLASGVKAAIYASPVLKSSRKPNWNSLRVIGTIDSTFVPGSSIKSMYTDMFPMPATGDTVAFCVMPVNSTSGITNSKVYMTSVASI
jgi:hypothetical protein